ncbi:MAG: tetratricopeptide repeat protein, partial [Chloroflexi bacterium]|nr:tetratricopeptide repeat protein [Chloroflexota bacterium]
AGRLACFQADFDAAWTWLHATEAIARQHGDERLLLTAEGNRALLLQQTGDFEAAADVARVTLVDARRLGDAWLEGRLLSVLARVALQQSDHGAAASCLEEAVALARRTRDRLSLAFALDELGDVERSRGSYERAGVLYEECLHILEGHRARAGSIPSLLHDLGYVALAAGDTRLATARFEQALANFHKQRDQRGMSECLLGLGAVAAAEGRAADAARLFGAGEAALETLGAELWPSNRADYARGVALARLALDAVAFEDAWREGRRVALDEAALSILARH